MLLPTLILLTACGSDAGPLPTDPSGPEPRTEISIQVQPDRVDLEVGDETQLEAIVTDASGEPVDGVPLDWTSSDPEVAEVDEEGFVRALASGEASVTVTGSFPATGQQLTASASVKAMPNSAASLSIEPGDPTVTVEDSLRLEATPMNASGEPLDHPVKWRTGDESVATVSEDGLVRALAVGSTTVTATSGGVEDSVSLTVAKEQVADVRVAPDSTSIEEGKAVELSAKVMDDDGDTLERAVTWSSSNASVATVDDAGLVTARSVGSVEITATSDGISDAAAIDVMQVPVASVTVSPSSAEVEEGSTVQLEATVEDADGNVLEGDVTWSSSNASVATVDDAGLVTAEAGGEANVVAEVDGVADTAQLSVDAVNSPPTASISSPQDGATYNSDDTITFEGSGSDPEDGTLTGSSLVWASDVEGQIGTGQSVSTVLSDTTHTITMTATDSDGASDSDLITVTVEVTDDTTSSETTSTDGELTGPGSHQPSGADHVWDLDTSRADQDLNNADEPAVFFGSRWTNPETDPDYGTFFGVPDSQVGETMDFRWKNSADDGRAALWTIRDFHTGPLDAMYVRLVFRFSENWQPHGSGTTKLINWEGEGGGNFTFNVNDQSDEGAGLALHNIPADEAVIWETADATLIQVGKWYDLELVIHRESAVGADDGRIEVYLNGTEVTGWNALGGSPSGTQTRLDQVTWFAGSRPGWDAQKIGPYWGGSGSTKSLGSGNHDFIRFREIYFSGSPIQ